MFYVVLNWRNYSDQHSAKTMKPVTESVLITSVCQVGTSVQCKKRDALSVVKANNMAS